MPSRRIGRRSKAVVKPAPLTPEDVPVGLTLDEVKDIRPKKYDRVQPSTKVTYKKHWRYFRVWRQSRGIPLSLVETAHVKQYLKDKNKERAKQKKRPLSAAWMGCATSSIHLSLKWEGLHRQVDWIEVGETVGQYRAKSRLSPTGVDGITREYFEAIETAAGVPRSGEWPEKTARRAAFDVALISLMRDCLLRREEAAAVKWGDIKVERLPGRVFGVLSIPFSKTDKFGKGAEGYISVETLARLQDMAVLRGQDPTRRNQLVFGIGDKQVANRIKAACLHAGLPGWFAGHSPRIGMAIDLAMYDTPLVGIMQSGRWRLPSTVMTYIKSIAAGDNAVARLHAARQRAGTSGWVAWTEVL